MCALSLHIIELKLEKKSIEWKIYEEPKWSKKNIIETLERFKLLVNSICRRFLNFEDTLTRILIQIQYSIQQWNQKYILIKWSEVVVKENFSPKK